MIVESKDRGIVIKLTDGQMLSVAPYLGSYAIIPILVGELECTPSPISLIYISDDKDSASGMLDEIAIAWSLGVPMLVIENGTVSYVGYVEPAE